MILEPASSIELLRRDAALKLLFRDLCESERSFIYGYLIDEDWATAFLAEPLARNYMKILGDHKQREVLRNLSGRFKRLECATWASNRTMHNKTIILPPIGVTYLTTANLTKGSWTLSVNVAARIASQNFTANAYAEFAELWNAAKHLPK